MYIRSNYVSSLPVPVKVRGRQIERILDVLPYSQYQVNQNGFIRSDFAVLTETNNELEMARVLQSMQEFVEANEADHSDLSFEEIVRQVKPRYVDTPAELDRFERYCIDHSIEFYKKFIPEEKETVSDVESKGD